VLPRLPSSLLQSCGLTHTTISPKPLLPLLLIDC
jgi:hypothetical protein